MDKEHITSKIKPDSQKPFVDPDQLARELAQARDSILESIASIEKNGTAIVKTSRERRQNQKSSK